MKHESGVLRSIVRWPQPCYLRFCHLGELDVPAVQPLLEHLDLTGDELRWRGGGHGHQLGAVGADLLDVDLRRVDAAGLRMTRERV